MPLSTDVTLPADVRPQWPPMCIRCGRSGPGAHYVFKGGRVGWDQIATLHRALGRRPRVEAPACAPCASALRSDRVWRTIALWAGALPACMVAFLLVHTWLTGPFRRWIGAAAALVVLAPWIIWELYHPPVIDATQRGCNVEYEFRDAEYALRFAELNEAHCV